MVKTHGFSHNPNARFAGSVPEMYDRHLGPVIFEPYAQDLARRVVAEVRSGPVLEVACGTGVLTQRLFELLPVDVELVATDLNEPMVEFARSKLGDDRVRWQQADAMNLPFPAASFTAVVCQFGLMFVPDKEAAFREARRVLGEGGLLAFSVWDSIEKNPIARIAHSTISRLFPKDPPNFYEVPFGFHDPKLLRQLLSTHGFFRPTIEHVTLEAVSPSAASFAEGLVRGNPVGAAIQDRGGSLDNVVQAIEMALQAECGDNPVRSPMRALVVMARAGSEHAVSKLLASGPPLTAVNF
jgi:ubiquinone/menaquinone biosynthesis C-methylase UbiE